MANHSGWSPPFTAGEALRCSVLRGFTESALSAPPWIVKGPLHTFKPDARIATTVRAGAKADDLNAKKSRVTGAAVALLFAFGALLPVRAGNPRMLHIDESYSGRTVKLVVGESLEISLAENPTTGYLWRLPDAAKDAAKDAGKDAASGVATAAANSACLFVKDSYEPGRAGVAGQGGVHRWQYQAIESGTCKIELEYRRSWEKDKLPERTFRIQVDVQKGVPGKDPT